MTDDERAPDPAESLRLIAQQRSDIERRIEPDYRWYYLPWGTAWLVSFGLLFLRFGPDGRALVAMPEALPFVVLAATQIAAAVITGIVGTHNTRHFAGDSRLIGLMYGLSWPIAFAWLGGLLGRISDQLATDEARLLWSAGTIGLVGVLYLAGGAIWRDRAMYGLGIWITLTNIAGIQLGPDWHSLVAALAGGGGLILAGFLFGGPTRRRLADEAPT